MKIKVTVFLLFLCVIQPVFADLMCDDAAIDYDAIYEIDSYTCSTGQYLPANTLGCVSCPTGSTCTGGTFDFNPDEYQGLEFGTITTNTINNICAANFYNNLYATYEPNQHTCTQGYYLPMGVDACRICLNDHYCPGGTYTFNETTDQGINNCPSAHPYAPQGMWLASQCGRKLHISDETYHDILYMHQSPANPTLHRLFVRVGETNYSANAVLRDMTPGAPFPKVSAGATKGLHILIHETLNGVEGDYEYLICDDSVPECRNEQ